MKFTKLVTLSLFMAMLSMTAFADTVTFSTTGDFCAGSGPCTSGNSFLQIGSGSQETLLQFVPLTQTVQTGTIVPLIDLSEFDIGSMARIGTGSFTIFVDQTVPSVGVGEFSGSVKGNFAVGATTGGLDFSANTLVIGAVTYYLPLHFDLAPNMSPPDTFTHVPVELTTTPEPTFFSLVGAGMLGLGYISHRRKSL